MKPRENTGVFRRSMAHVNCNATTPRTKYLVNGSGPQSLSTLKTISCDAIGIDLNSSDFWMRLYDGLPPRSMGFLGIRPEKLVPIEACWCLSGQIKLRGSLHCSRVDCRRHCLGNDELRGGDLLNFRHTPHSKLFDRAASTMGKVKCGLRFQFMFGSGSRRCREKYRLELVQCIIGQMDDLLNLMNLFNACILGIFPCILHTHANDIRFFDGQAAAMLARGSCGPNNHPLC